MRFFFFIKNCAHHISNVLKHFPPGSVTCGTKTAYTSERDLREKEIFDSPSFCQLTLASGTVWTCSGYGDFHLFKAVGSEYEPLVLEFLEYFMVKSLIHKFKKNPVWATNITACFQYGLAMPVIDFYSCQQAKDSQGQVNDYAIADVHQGTHYKKGSECRYCSGCKNCPLKLHMERLEYLSHSISHFKK